MTIDSGTVYVYNIDYSQKSKGNGMRAHKRKERSVEPHPIDAWMKDKGYTCYTLARELGYTYEYIFKIAVGDRKGSSDFEMKFVNRFGTEEARKVFANSRVLAMLESLPTP